MSRKITNPMVFIHHWRWLEANGYKKEAASCKLQASGGKLDKKSIQCCYILDNQGERNYANKRSFKNYRRFPEQAIKNAGLVNRFTCQGMQDWRQAAEAVPGSVCL